MNDVVVKILKFLFSSDKKKHPIPPSVTEEITKRVNNQILMEHKER